MKYPRPEPRRLDDSDRNILAGLKHEADEPCLHCGQGVSPIPVSPTKSTWEFTHEGQPVHEECSWELTHGERTEHDG